MLGRFGNLFGLRVLWWIGHLLSGFLCIPRHTFHQWPVLKGKLKTQDRLRQWDVGPSTDLNLLQCPLCGSYQDSHAHLFFECSFSSHVWFRVTNYAEMQIASNRMDDIIPCSSRLGFYCLFYLAIAE